MRPAVLFVIALSIGACKADAEKCEKAVRNYATLTYWQRANAEIAAAPAAQREALRKKHLSAFTADLEQKVALVTSQCQSANNEDQIDCMIAAKTGDEALECADLVTNEK
jgi:hypothetical protein